MSYVTSAARKAAFTSWEHIWYVLQCVAFGAGYFSKVPAKKALQDFGLVTMTNAEQFWYVLMCVAFGAGYFAKIPTAKALSELPQYRTEREAALGTLSPSQPLAVPPTVSPPPQVPQPSDPLEGTQDQS